MKFFTKFSLLQLVILLSAILLLQGCDDDPTRNRRELDFSTVPDPFDISQADTSYTKDGVEIHIIEEGDGRFEVIARDQISLFLTGRTSEGEIFRSTYANGNVRAAVIRNLKPVSQIINNQTVDPQIEGLRRGLLGMEEGEKRVIMVPDSLGYNDSNPGVRGVDIDLRDKDLRYDIELSEILE
jgi:FKBP-type peptidyl-prolyl cis-trans isomerase